MNIEEKYLLWLNHPNMDQDLKEELVSMDEKQKEKEEVIRRNYYEFI